MNDSDVEKCPVRRSGPKVSVMMEAGAKRWLELWTLHIAKRRIDHH